MTALGMLDDLVQHMGWADARVWSCVLDVPELASDRTIHERMYHLHLVQRGFLLLWLQPTTSLPEPPQFSDAVALASWGHEYHRELAEYLTSSARSAPDSPVNVPWATHVTEQFGRSAEPTTFGETMLQVMSHSTHHRGQVNTRIRELGAEPPLIDFIVWLWLGRPGAEWPAAAGRLGQAR